MTGDGRRLFVARRGDGNMFAVTVDDDELYYCGWTRARTLVAHLNRWQPDDDQLASFLHWLTPEAREYVAGMRRITVRWDTTCVRCGQTIQAGERASWDPASRLVVHGQRCPLKKATA